MEAPVLITPKQANTSGRNGSPQWIRTVIATPEIRREWSQAVVILFPESKRPDGTWSSISIPVSNLEVPEGENLFLNATTSGLVLEIDGKRKLMPPGQKQTLKSVTNKGRIRVRLYAKDQKGEVRLLYTGSHWNRAEKGNLYLIYSQNQDRFRVLKMNVEDFSASTSQP